MKRRLLALFLAALALLTMGCGANLPDGAPIAPAAERTRGEIEQRLLDGLRSRDETISDLGRSAEAVGQAVRSVWLDHPELFWFTGGGTTRTATLGGTVTGVSFEPEYAYSEPEIAQLERELDAVYEAIGLRLGGKSDYEKVRGVYEYVIETVDYSGDAGEQDIVPALLRGSGVCAAYARAVQALLLRLDVPCRYVTGTARGESHAWNLVCIEGSWYHVDATWGDPSYSGEAAEFGVSYAYLCLTDEQILRTRTVEDGQELPACTDETWNYYRVSGLYLEKYSYDGYSAVYTAALAGGSSAVSVMFGSREAYRAALAELISCGGLLQAQQDAEAALGLTPASEMHYVCDDELWILTVLPS